MSGGENDPAKERIIQYIHLHGIKENEGGFIRCLWHDEKTPSMSYHGESRKFHCFGCGESHDVYDFAAKFHNLDVKQDFNKIRSLVYQELGLEAPSSLPGLKSPGLVAIAADALPYVYSNERLKRVGKAAFKLESIEVESVYPYRNEAGEVEYIECRYPASSFRDGKKKVLSLWFDGNAVKSRGCPVRLYGRDRLAASPGLPVVIHEGAKCAEAAGEKLLSFVHTAYNGGGKKLKAADLSPLKGREVFIYPDDDQDARVGLATARLLRRRLKEEYGVEAAVVEPVPEARSLKASGADIVEALQVMEAPALEEWIRSRRLADEAAEGAGFFLDEGYQLHEAAFRAAGAVNAWYEAEGKPGIFSRDGAVLEPREGKFRAVSLTRMRVMLSQACLFESRGRPISPPIDITMAVHAGADGFFRPVDRIITYPVITSSGRVVSGKGYDEETRCYYDIPSLPPVASSAEARGILDDIFTDFPFMAEADRAGLIGMLLTFILRPKISGPVPAFIVQAPVVGTGKTKLLTVALSLLVGEGVTIQTLPRDEEEMRKTLGSFIMAGYPYFFFDNVKGKLRGDFIEAAVTGKHVAFRIVGKAEAYSARNDFVFLFTSNNPVIETDLLRRLVPVNLDANRERPYDTAGVEYRHPDIEGYALGRRGEALSALLFLASQAGAGYEGPVKGGFESWSRAVGSALSAGGYAGFLENAETMAEDEGEGAFYGFVEAWAEKYGTLPVAAKDLLGLADDAGIIPDNAHDRLKSLGRMLSYRKSRIFAGYKIVVKRNQHTKNLTFYLLDIKPGEEPAGEPAASILDSYLPAETPELAFF